MYVDCADWVVISIICRGHCSMYNKSIMWDEFSNFFCWVMETFSLQKDLIHKLEQLLLLSAEVYEFSINPPPDEPYCFYKVPSYLNGIVPFVHHTLPPPPWSWTGSFHWCTGAGAVETSCSKEGSVHTWPDWLIDWLIDWLFEYLLTHWLIGWLIDWLIDWSIDWWLVGEWWLVDWLINWLINCLHLTKGYVYVPEITEDMMASLVCNKFQARVSEELVVCYPRHTLCCVPTHHILPTYLGIL